MELFESLQRMFLFAVVRQIKHRFVHCRDPADALSLLVVSWL